jgi:hypothetical protein
MSIRGFCLCVGAFATAVSLQGARPAFGQFSDLLSRLPGSANSLVMIDVDAVYRSPMALRKGWKEHFATKSSEQPIILPPEAKRFVLASHLDPLNNLHSDWEVAVIDLAEPLSLNLLARAEGGYIDSIGNTQVVWTPSHAYLIELDKQLMGMVYPDDRQAVSHWVDWMKTGKNTPLSPYLERAAKSLRRDGQIVLAIDLTNVLQPHRIDKALKETRILEGKNVNPRAVAESLSSLQGVTVTIQIGSEAQAEVRIDFADNIRMLKPFAKELVLAAMNRIGASVNDPDQWKTEVEENAILFRGQLTEAGLTRLSGLLELPTSKFSTLKDEVKQTQDPAKAQLEATKRYFKSLEKLLTSLRQESRTSNLWYEKTARKIDGLPILNVDEELLGFGSWLAKQLRQMAEGLRGVGRQVNVAQSYGPYSDVGSYGGYGYYRNSTGVNLAQGGAQAGGIRSGGMEQIDNALSDVRRAMTKKYQIEF